MVDSKGAIVVQICGQEIIIIMWLHLHGLWAGGLLFFNRVIFDFYN